MGASITALRTNGNRRINRKSPQTNERLASSSEGVPQTEGVRRLVVLPLIHEVRIPCVVAEHLVVEVQSVDHRTQTLPEAIARLRIHLEVSQRVSIAGGPCRTKCARISPTHVRGRHIVIGE